MAVDYTLQPLPAISMAQVNTLRVDYHKTIGASEPIVLTADLGDNTRSGRLCVSGLEKGVSYDFGYTVSVDLIGLSVSPPGDFPQDIDVRIPSSCNTPEQVCQGLFMIRSYLVYPTLVIQKPRLSYTGLPNTWFIQHLVHPKPGLSNIYEKQTWLDKRGSIVCASVYRLYLMSVCVSAGGTQVCYGRI